MEADILHNEKTFYPAFIKDMLGAKNEVIIFSPFISKFRADYFRKTLLKLRKKKVSVFIFTRTIAEQDESVQDDVLSALDEYRELGVHVYCIEGHVHEKVAIIDNDVVWMGSLNILSQRLSKEVMIRKVDNILAKQLLSKLKIKEKLIRSYRERRLTHNIKLSLAEKTAAFLFKPVALVLKWILHIVVQLVKFLLRTILFIFNILDIILA